MRTLLSVAMAAMLLPGPAAAAEPDYPTKPIRFIAANSAGGGLDVVARAISPKLSAVFGQQVIVDNRAGAAGSIASEITAHSAPDGYTIMVSSLGGLAVNTNLYKGLQYHPLRDFAPVTWATSQSNVLVVNRSPSRPPTACGCGSAPGQTSVRRAAICRFRAPA